MSIAMMIPTANCTTPQNLAPIALSGVARATSHPLRIGFWGTQSGFSQTVLATLLHSYTVSLVALPAELPGPAVTVRHPSNLALAADELVLINNDWGPDTLQIAWQHHIPAYMVQHLSSVAVKKWLADQTLDIVCVACFPWRIPDALLALPTYGFLNLHPSLLPAYRGPAPLFWQLRAGCQTGGATVHWMDAKFDTGAIAAQTAVTFPDGATNAELDALCAAAGADLFCAVLQQLGQGVVVRQPQPTGGSYQTWPTPRDFRLEAQWSARHAYNFMRGTDVWQQPYGMTIAGEELWLRRALAYEPAAVQDCPLVYNGREVLLQLTPGVLRALLW